MHLDLESVLSVDDDHITFVVDDVQPGKDQQANIPVGRKLERLASEPVVLCSRRGECPSGHRVHSLLEAVHTAWAEHLVLELRPDDIWLIICQGLVHHIHQHPDLLRERAVLHQGRPRLSALYDDGFDPTIIDWYDFLEQWRDGVAATAPDLADLVVARFSTTGPDERAAYIGALLDLASWYFAYGLDPICGIPAVTLRGTVEDWRDLAARIERLATYGIDFWLEPLRRIGSLFLESRLGRVDRAAWRRIYQFDSSCSVAYVSGWIGELFPYILNGRNTLPDRRNPLLTAGEVRHGVQHTLFPNGLNKVTIRDASRPEGGLTLVTGFVGCETTAEGSTIGTSIGWGLTSVASPRPALDIVGPHLTQPGVTAEAIEQAIRVELLDMPPHLQALYRCGNGGRIPLGKLGHLDILPFARLESVESRSDHKEYDHLKPLDTDAVPRFRYDLVRFARFSDGTDLHWAQRDGGPEIIFVRRDSQGVDKIVAVSLKELAQRLTRGSESCTRLEECLRNGKTWPF